VKTIANPGFIERVSQHNEDDFPYEPSPWGWIFPKHGNLHAVRPSPVFDATKVAKVSIGFRAGNLGT